MANHDKHFSTHIKRSLAWTTGSYILGFAPLLILNVINVLSEVNLCAKEIELLSKAGVLVFISCAITGTVVLDHILSAYKISGWLSQFAIYVFPFFIFGYLFLKYLLKYILNEDPDVVGPGGLTSILAVCAMVIYTVFAKALYYLKQSNSAHV